MSSSSSSQPTDDPLTSSTSPLHHSHMINGSVNRDSTERVPDSSTSPSLPPRREEGEDSSPPPLPPRGIPPPPRNVPHMHHHHHPHHQQQQQQVPEQRSLINLLNLNITIPRMMSFRIQSSARLEVTAAAGPDGQPGIFIQQGRNPANNNNNNNTNTNNGNAGDAGVGRAGTPEGNGPNAQVFTVRSRLFRVIFMKIALLYALAVPKKIQRVIEFSVLAAAFASLFILAYLHVAFIRSPINCLEGIQNDWPKDGVLRVEIIVDPSTHRPYGQEWEVRNEGDEMFILNSVPRNSDDLTPSTSSSERDTENTERLPDLDDGMVLSIIKESSNLSQVIEPSPALTVKLPTPHIDSLVSRSVWPSDNYIVEYSLEYGFLRLSAKTRQKLNIPVRIVTLDPNKDACFGDDLSRFLLRAFLGYDDILMGSLKGLAEKQNNKGYVRNVITGEHYRFVNIWMTRTSYIAAAFIMLVFTLTISMLLRYSHHQVFVFVAELMQMLEFNGNLSFPFAPLLTVILALVGMEAIMSEFFNDTTTAFYVILIVWEADQFDAMCAHTPVTRKHWLKFFYLYHFAFYAYDYRFNGQYSGLALLTSWLFTQHSMIYFFHHFELPYILSQTTTVTLEGNVRFIQTNPMNRNLAPVVNGTPSQQENSSQTVTPSENQSSQTETQPSPSLSNNSQEAEASSLPSPSEPSEVELRKRSVPPLSDLSSMSPSASGSQEEGDRMTTSTVTTHESSRDKTS